MLFSAELVVCSGLLKLFFSVSLKQPTVAAGNLVDENAGTESANLH